MVVASFDEAEGAAGCVSTPAWFGFVRYFLQTHLFIRYADALTSIGRSELYAGRSQEKSLISQTTEYAIRAIIELAQQEPAVYILAKDLAGKLDLPHHYLGKILQQLSRAGILESVRGRQGGFRLARPANTIKLREVIEPFENVEKKEECILGQDKCNDKVACPLHPFWKEVRNRYVMELETKSVADLVDFGRRRRAASQ